MADKDKGKGKTKKHARADHSPAGPPLPGTRAELLELHRQTRARRNAAALGSPDHVEAIVLISRIEVEIARIERAMDPPLG
jgi:hypothetical protein